MTQFYIQEVQTLFGAFGQDTEAHVHLCVDATCSLKQSISHCGADTVCTCKWLIKGALASIHG